MATKSGRRNDAAKTNSTRAQKARTEIGEAVRDIKQGAAVAAARRQEDLGSVGRGLVDAGVPAWTVRAHNRFGHVGGFVIFACLTLIGWPVSITLVATVVRVLGINIVTRLPAMVLGDLGVPVELAASTTDRFLFTWVMPVLFFVLVLAGLSSVVLWKLAKWAWAWTVRLALGLFAGYGTGVMADRRQRRARSRTGVDSAD